MEENELNLEDLESVLGGVSQEVGEEEARKNQIDQLKQIREELIQKQSIQSGELSEEELEHYTAGRR